MDDYDAVVLTADQLAAMDCATLAAVTEGPGLGALGVTGIPLGELAAKVMECLHEYALLRASSPTDPSRTLQVTLERRVDDVLQLVEDTLRLEPGRNLEWVVDEVVRRFSRAAMQAERAAEETAVITDADKSRLLYRPVLSFSPENRQRAIDSFVQYIPSEYPGMEPYAHVVRNMVQHAVDAGQNPLFAHLRVPIAHFHDQVKAVGASTPCDAFLARPLQYDAALRDAADKKLRACMSGREASWAERHVDEYARIVSDAWAAGLPAATVVARVDAEVQASAAAAEADARRLTMRYAPPIPRADVTAQLRVVRSVACDPSWLRFEVA